MSVPVVLQSTTDPRWFQLAVERWQELLLDHANCEKKAASTALALMFLSLIHISEPTRPY